MEQAREDTDQFKKSIRMDYITFTFILNKIWNKIQKIDTNFRKCISPEMRLVTIIRVMLDKNSSDYFPSTLFYDYINNLLTCFSNNIMSILYKNENYVNFVNIISGNNFVFKYCDICIFNFFFYYI